MNPCLTHGKHARPGECLLRLPASRLLLRGLLPLRAGRLLLRGLLPLRARRLPVRGLLPRLRVLLRLRAFRLPWRPLCARVPWRWLFVVGCFLFVCCFLFVVVSWWVVLLLPFHGVETDLSFSNLENQAFR